MITILAILIKDNYVTIQDSINGAIFQLLIKVGAIPTHPIDLNVRIYMKDITLQMMELISLV